jgi:hypothetical protein
VGAFLRREQRPAARGTYRSQAAHIDRLSSYNLRIVDSNFPDCFKSTDSSVHKPRI